MRVVGRAFLVQLLLLTGCAGVSADAPLTITLGQSRPQTEDALKTHEYCRATHEPAKREEVYPRCDRPGTEYGDSWVSAVYEGERLVELRRWERFSDDNKAVERWNQLVTDRAKTTQPWVNGEKELRDRGLFEAGTRSVKVFKIDDNTIAGVYLLTPSPPENAAVLERVAYIQGGNGSSSSPVK